MVGHNFRGSCRIHFNHEFILSMSLILNNLCSPPSLISKCTTPNDDKKVKNDLVDIKT